MSLRENLRKRIQSHAGHFPDLHTTGERLGLPQAVSSLIEPRTLDNAFHFDHWHIDPGTGYRMRGKA